MNACVQDIKGKMSNINIHVTQYQMERIETIFKAKTDFENFDKNIDP